MWCRGRSLRHQEHPWEGTASLGPPGTRKGGLPTAGPQLEAFPCRHTMSASGHCGKAPRWAPLCPRHEHGHNPTNRKLQWACFGGLWSHSSLLPQITQPLAHLPSLLPRLHQWMITCMASPPTPCIRSSGGLGLVQGGKGGRDRAQEGAGAHSQCSDSLGGRSWVQVLVLPFKLSDSPPRFWK